MRLKLREWSRANFFQKELKQTITHPLPPLFSLLHCSFISDVGRTFVALSFVHPMTKKIAQFDSRNE